MDQTLNQSTAPFKLEKLLFDLLFLRAILPSYHSTELHG